MLYFYIETQRYIASLIALVQKRFYQYHLFVCDLECHIFIRKQRISNYSRLRSKHMTLVLLGFTIITRKTLWNNHQLMKYLEHFILFNFLLFGPITFKKRSQHQKTGEKGMAYKLVCAVKWCQMSPPFGLK